MSRGTKSDGGGRTSFEGFESVFFQVSWQLCGLRRFLEVQVRDNLLKTAYCANRKKKCKHAFGSERNDQCLKVTFCHRHWCKIGLWDMDQTKVGLQKKRRRKEEVAHLPPMKLNCVVRKCCSHVLGELAMVYNGYDSWYVMILGRNQ